MNPFRRVEGVFGPEQINAWQNMVSNDDLATRAHAYKVVERAYRGMSEKQVDQSILVSGMSGAGKTETVKICINYLSSIGGVQSKLERRINDAGVALESFGNAFTVHNANSSRFGKYTKMFFQYGGSMVGAKLNTYLLEKTRVAHPPEDERNFHIFYQLLHGLSTERKAKLHLTVVGDYQILSTQPGVRNSNGALAFANDEQTATDATTYSELLERLRRLGFADESIENLIKLLAGILHLGNVRFGETTHDGQDSSPELIDDENSAVDDGISFVETRDSLEIAAELLGVESEALETALTKLSLKSVQNTVLPLSRAKAELALGSLIAETYERVFNWIVEQLNAALAVNSEEFEDEDDLGYIAILDISGYESVATNGFEQININYTNDKLMQLYNELLYAEQDLYAREFPHWDKVEFDTDLKDTIALIERKPEGVLPLLDTVCYRQNASDNLFVTELGSYTMGTPRGNTRCIYKVNPDTLRFHVHHAPGPVEYCGRGFVVKNRDVLPASLEQLMQRSSSNLCATIFEKPAEKGSTSSVGKFYMGQLDDLTDAIRETDYAFIKCIKPNAHNEPRRINREFVVDQIKWCGAIETLQVCAAGYPERFIVEDFVQLFAPLVDQNPAELKEADTKTNLGVAKQIVDTHLQTAEGRQEAVFGLSKLFISMNGLFKLRALKKAKEQSSGSWLTKAKSAFGWIWK